MTKKIMIIDGGPRKKFNTAAMCAKVAEGVRSVGGEAKIVRLYDIAYNTYQVKNYDRYELAGFSEEAKRQWRDEHWEEDLQKAFEAGQQMAEK
jgi:multimeric flavodoxin WrbA